MTWSWWLESGMTWSQERAEWRMEGEEGAVTLEPGAGRGMWERMMGASSGLESSTLSRETQTTLQVQQRPMMRPGVEILCELYPDTIKYYH